MQSVKNSEQVVSEAKLLLATTNMSHAQIAAATGITMRQSHDAKYNLKQLNQNRQAAEELRLAIAEGTADELVAARAAAQTAKAEQLSNRNAARARIVQLYKQGRGVAEIFELNDDIIVASDYHNTYTRVQSVVGNHSRQQRNKKRKHADTTTTAEASDSDSQVD